MLIVLLVVHDFIGVYILENLSNISFKYVDFIVCQLNLDRAIKLYFFIQRFFLWQILYVSGFTYIYIYVCVCVCVWRNRDTCFELLSFLCLLTVLLSRGRFLTYHVYFY